MNAVLEIPTVETAPLPRPLHSSLKPLGWIYWIHEECESNVEARVDPIDGEYLWCKRCRCVVPESEILPDPLAD